MDVIISFELCSLSVANRTIMVREDVDRHLRSVAGNTNYNEFSIYFQRIQSGEQKINKSK